MSKGCAIWRVFHSPSNEFAPSGKKSPHHKDAGNSNPDKRILFLSNPYRGSVHDYSVLQAEFNPGDPLRFSENDVYVDLGFLGIERDYAGERVRIPRKRGRGISKTDPKIAFTATEKVHNKKVSSERIYVENVIGGMKRYCWLTHRLRCRDAHYYSMIAGLAAGLWNFSLKPRKT